MKNKLEVQPKLSVENDVSVETFVVLVKSGIELWSKAGEMLVKLVDKDPNIYASIIDKFSFITFEMLLAFEKMGRRQIYPALLMDTSPGAQRLLELPYECQEKFSKEPVEVVIDASNGEIKTEKKYVKELSAYESNMVFDREGVRPKEAQAEYAKTHSKPGRKSIRVKEADTIGTFVLKLSPSGQLVAEKSNSKVSWSQTITLRKTNGIKQAFVRIQEQE